VSKIDHRPVHFLPFGPESALMASDKKRRKQAPVGGKPQKPTGGQKPRSKDGDRRRRGPDLARLATELKEASRQWNLDVGWTDDAPKESE
jgi:hypothetical protein